MTTLSITPKNWERFQHYKKRSPPWIRLYYDLVDNLDFICLPVASKALAPMLWLIASRCEDATINGTAAKLAARLRMTEGELMKALNPLIIEGFFTCSQDASTARARRKQSATPETETETETEEEEANASSLSAKADLSEAIRLWNELSSEVPSIPTVQRVTEPRKQKLTLRLTEIGGLEGWSSMLEKIRGSPHLRGENGWTVFFDWVLEPRNLTKIMEGNYDRRNGTNGRMGTTEARAQAYDVLDAIVQEAERREAETSH